MHLPDTSHRVRPVITFESRPRCVSVCRACWEMQIVVRHQNNQLTTLTGASERARRVPNR
jgi:hypothetical protein